jgi:hypothetical protein
MSFKKHVGRLKNTDRRCVVVMTRIPGREDHALIVDTDALPDRFHDALMHLIESHEGQQVMELHTLLSRRILPDFGVDMLNALHNARALQPQPINNIIMFPQPHSPVPLSLIVEMMDKEAPVTADEQTDLENRHLENQKVDASEAQIATAQNLLIQAADLQAEADKKREQAYRMAPALRPAASAPAAPVEAPAAPAATVETIATVEDISPVPPAVPFDAGVVDTSDLPADVAAAFQAAVEQAATVTETQAEILTESVDSDEDAAHAVDAGDDAIQAFLDRAAFREDRANKIATEAAEPKRPVGRPRKDGSPAGSARG